MLRWGIVQYIFSGGWDICWLFGQYQLGNLTRCILVLYFGIYFSGSSRVDYRNVFGKYCCDAGCGIVYMGIMQLHQIDFNICLIRDLTIVSVFNLFLGKYMIYFEGILFHCAYFGFVTKSNECLFDLFWRRPKGKGKQTFWSWKMTCCYSWFEIDYLFLFIVPH